MNFIEIKNVTYKSSSNNIVLDDISLTIKEKDFVIICGANGSGKSTLVKLLNGLVIPDKGEVFVSNIEVKKNLRKVRELVGMVFQNTDSQIVGETIYDDIAFGLENLSLDEKVIRKRVVDIIEEFDLMEILNTPPYSLSGGEKKKLCIASVLVMKPKVIVFDEPFMSLDFFSKKKIMKEIIKLHKKGHTIIVITHNLDEIIKYANKILIMSKGNVAGYGKPNDFLNMLENFGVKKPYEQKF